MRYHYFRFTNISLTTYHTKNSWPGMLKSEVLVGKLVSVDRLSASTVVIGEITTLAHEICDHAVEAASCKSVTTIKLY